MKRRAQAGFTLLEVTTLGAVLALVATSVLSALPSMMAANNRAEDLQHANAFLRHAQAEVAEVAYSNLGTLDGMVIDEGLLDGTALEGLDGFEARLFVVDVSPAMRQVLIQIVHFPRTRSGGPDGETERVIARAITRRAAR